ncbi:MAG: DUF2927 domain-containing protein [Alphaproteobacteria bacterium]|nr:DUF2927 domain-containing protein [Alphaproteobacteria bacterium]
MGLRDRIEAGVRRRARLAVGLCAGFLLGASPWFTGLAAADPHSEVNNLAPVSVLAESFAQIAFELEWPRAQYRHLRKWDGPVRVVMLGPTALGHGPFVDEHLAKLSRLTGLDIARVPTTEPHNLRIYFVTSPEMPAIAEFHNIEPRLFERVAGKSACMYAFTTDQRRAISQGIAILATDFGSEYVRACIIEETTQLLGLPMDNELIQPSVFSNEGLLDRLSINDQLLVRALYDPRLPVGMERGPAQLVAHRVIAELWQGVRRDGHRALHQ